jgi:hypothetical protein
MVSFLLLQADSDTTVAVVNFGRMQALYRSLTGETQEWK